MAFFNEAWFIHAVNDTVTQLAQQRQSQVRGAVRTRENVVGKTEPFNRIASQDMVSITTRDADTSYANPAQSKRRAILNDFGLAVLIDDFDQLKTLTNLQSEHSQILGYALERKLDDLVLNISTTGVGGALGTATTVDEAAETTSSSTLPAAQQIANGGTNLTMAKIRSVGEKFDTADVFDDERYFFYSPLGMKSLLSDNTVTSSDFNTIQALTQGKFPQDAMWYGMKWRKSNKLPKSGNIRSCIAVQKMGVGLALGTVKGVEIDKATHKWNNMQAVIKLSGGSVRVDDLAVVMVDIDESV